MEQKQQTNDLELTIEAFRLSQEHLSIASCGTGVGMWDYDVLNDRLKWNDQMFQLYGVDPASFSGSFSGWKQCVLAEDLPGAESDFLAALQGEKDFRTQFRIVKEEGEVRYLAGSGSVMRDEAGKAIRVVGINFDITERVQMEEALHRHTRQLDQEKANLQTIFECAQVALMLLDSHLRVVRVNETARRLAHAEDRKVLGLRPGEFFRCVKALTGSLCIQAPACADCIVHTAARQALETGQPTRDEEAALTFRDGGQDQKRWFSVSASRLLLNTEAHALLVLVDITRLKQTEAELQTINQQLETTVERANQMALEAEVANISKSEFLANMSHEIRTPMNGVIGMTGLLLDTELTPEQRHYAEVVRTSAEGLLTLINDILDFSKIEAGHLEMEVLDFDLEILLEQFAQALAVRSNEKGVEFACHLSEEAPALLRGDPGRLRQVLSNLAGNAIKFTHEGIVTVQAAPEWANDQQVKLRFSVSDTGIGIPPDRQMMIFTPFTQADGSTTRQYGGTGLGLSISKQLVGLMGGEIGLESEPGKGSTFWFTAVFDRQPDIVRQEPRKPQPAIENLRGLRVLAIDDNEINLEILEGLFRRWGIDCLQTISPENALRLLHQAAEAGKPVDLAVIDMLMPDMDGLELARRIKADAAISSTHLLLLTSLGRQLDEVTLSKAGIFAHLTKPLRRGELQQAIIAAMTGQPLARPLSPSTQHDPCVPLQKYRLLLAEDNITNQQVAIGMLHKMGYRVDAAANGREAIHALESIPYDLVLMDVQMPLMDGFEATAAIRSPKSCVLNRNIPIIAMTAHAMQGDREKCMEAGMNDYIAKPVTKKALGTILAHWLADTKSLAPTETGPEQPDAGKPAPRPFDPAHLAEQLGNDQELIGQILATFIEDGQQQIEAIEQTGSRRDFPVLAKDAHKLKGSALNIGALPLHEAALAIEIAAKKADGDSMPGLLKQLPLAWEELKTAIDQNSSSN